MKLNLLKRSKSSITQTQISNKSGNVVQTQILKAETSYQNKFQIYPSIIISDKSSAIVNSTYNIKNVTKRQAKRSIKKRFKIGGRYFLHLKSRDGSRYVLKEFVCKKFIYSLHDNIMNIVIMQQVAGELDKKFTLNKNECKQFHIKYEPGLEVYSMELNWIPERKNSKLCVI